MSGLPVNRRRLWEILEPARPCDLPAKAADIFISAVIMLSIAGNILSEEAWFPVRLRPLLEGTEFFSTVVFVIEYCARLWSCAEDPRYRGPFGRLRWALRPMSIIDFLAMMSGVLWFVHVDLKFLRVLRLLRLLRLGRYSAGIQLIRETFADCRHELTVVVSGLFTVLFISAGVMHIAEREAQPEVFGSFLTALWWGVCTLTTVGYGDVVPVTALGRTAAGVIAVLGIGAFALPSGIIAAHFNNVLQRRERQADQKPDK